MSEFVLKAKSRPSSSRNAVRRMRRDQALVPAILYGGDSQPVSLSLPADIINRHALEEGFYTHVLKLVIDDQEHDVVVKDVQRHPYRRQVVHLDFLRIMADRALTMHVPIHLLNVNESAGVRAGGIVNHLLNELEIRCLPKHIPESIEADIAELDLEQTLHLSDVKLPEGVELLHAVDAEHNPGIVAIHKPRAESVATPSEEAAPETTGETTETAPAE